MMSRLLGWLTLFLIGTDLFVVSPLLPAITEELGVSATAGGATVTIFALAYLVGGPTLGALADRKGRYLVLASALVLFAIANAATALAPNLAVLLIVRAVAGLAASGITPAVYALIGASAPDGQRARWLAVVTSGLLLALATGAPAGSLLGAAVTWRGSFGLLALASVAVLVATIQSWKRSQPSSAAGESTHARESSKSDDEGNQDQSSQQVQVSIWTRVRAVSVTALWATAVYGLYTYLGTILHQTMDASAGAIAIALVCFGLGAVLGNLAGGHLADRRGGRVVSIITLLLLAATETAVGLILGHSTVLLLVMLGVTALVAYPFFSAQQARLIAAYPSVSGSLMAWNNSAMYAGILIGSGAGGQLLTAWGASPLAFTTAAVAVIAALVAIISIPAAHRDAKAQTP